MNLTTKIFVALQLAILAVALAFYVTIPAGAMASLPQKQCYVEPIDTLNVAFCSQFYGLPPASNDAENFDYNNPDHIEWRERMREDRQEAREESRRGDSGAMETFSDPAPEQGD